jgi:XTP/dITP diphosphohydrolase
MSLALPARLVLASNNAGKLREFGALLAPLGIELIAQGALAIPEAEEPYASFLENALAKARHAAALSGSWALADDSGLCVDALRGAPGVLSARYAGEPRDDARNNAQLLHELAGVADRSAAFVCTLVLLRHPADPDPLVAQGRWSGQIALSAAGDGGFGYDPLFWLPAQGCTSAQLPPDLKNLLSHRAQALRRLLELMQPVTPG